MRARVLLGALGAAASLGCSDVWGVEFDGYEVGPGAASLGIARVKPTRDKLDLLLVVDNSIGMQPKQALLSSSLSHALGRLVNPPCVKEGSSVETPAASPSSACESGQRRLFQPVSDVHVGVVTSSLGSHGAVGGACAEGSIGFNPTQADMAHLLGTLRTGLPGDQGFVKWTPAQTEQTLVDQVAQHVSAAGATGCGWEAPLEAMYRFLVDPAPYASITLKNQQAVLSADDDEVLLGQRATFLRDDSALGVVLLGDENDCSIVDGGPSWRLLTVKQPNNEPMVLPRPTAACATDPLGPCCRSCAIAETTPPVGCAPLPEDPACKAGAFLPEADDSPNLRCFQPKRRFGFQWLQPMARYVAGFRDETVPGRGGEPVQNPLFFSGQKRNGRQPGDVVVGGIVGLVPGLVDLLPSDAGWVEALGDPEKYVDPADPHMVESTVPRKGMPTYGAPTTDPVSGFDWDTQNSSLQYACIFDKPAPVSCTTTPGCECNGTPNPLCDPPTSASQARDGARPGLRQLDLLRQLGESGVAGSICADPGLSLRAFADRVGNRMSACNIDVPVRHADGSLPCVLVEASPGVDGACDCTGPGRYPVEPYKAGVARAEAERLGLGQGACLCQIDQLLSEALTQCQEGATPPSEPGWCYLAKETRWFDGSVVPAVGAPSVLGSCGRKIRFTAAAAPEKGSTLLLLCVPEALPPQTAPGCTTGESCSQCPNACERCLCQRAGDRATCDYLRECT